MEKHWCGTISRNIGEDFWSSHVSKATSFRDVPPVIATSKYYLIHVQRGTLFFLAVMHGEVPPLMTLELLERIASLFQDYFGNLNDEVIKENFVVCYQLLEEMIDNGYPVTTEPSLLKDIVPPPSLVDKIKSVVTPLGPSSLAPGPIYEHSGVPWRKAGLKYTNNEVFFDIVEELDAIIDINGQLINSEINGKIEANSHLSGFPEVLVSFVNPQILVDVAFHPCVRFSRYEQDRSLSFVPPDGAFELMKYRVQHSSPAPFYVNPKVALQKNMGTLNFLVGLRPFGNTLPEKGIQDVKCSLQLPENTEDVRLEATVGTYTFDSVTKELVWDVGRITPQKAPSIKGSFYPSSGTEFREHVCTSVNVEFRIPTIPLSGLKIETVTVLNERYRPYKGVRGLTKAGHYQIRLM